LTRWWCGIGPCAQTLAPQHCCQGQDGQESQQYPGGDLSHKVAKTTRLSSKPGCSVDELVCLSRCEFCKVPMDQFGTCPRGHLSAGKQTVNFGWQEHCVSAPADSETLREMLQFAF
jgi:hypothetical protein